MGGMIFRVPYSILMGANRILGTNVLSDEHAGIIYVFIEPGGVLVFLSVSHIELWHDPACVDCVQQVAYTLHSTLYTLCFFISL